ncbi:hypothetical protein [Methylobacter sp. BlB1]|uniref:hypothetical protein n=1 Tax=Methylobacter sp. BlB1 TaxID=2785914 RepID=UPI001894EEDA|nr:hypothetical protein [Methylobacter sp. BlB1]MBF6647171.1 hypothetical protein [Methylobacter sp. BlB1]
MQNLIKEPILAEPLDSALLLDKIIKCKWWQGSLISAGDIQNYLKDCKDVDWWIITTQACNIYNSNFEKVPVFEVVAACEIEECHPRMSKGDDPRILHVEVQFEEKIKALELDIQRRKWLPRALLAKLPAPKFHVRDVDQNIEIGWSKKKWLDNFVGWMGRSYTRLALPDDFNFALRKSKIEDVLKEKLTKYHEQLYGIYISISSYTDEEWKGLLGEMPAPYLLEVMLVTYEDADPEDFKNKLTKHLFEDEVSDPNAKETKITRAKLAERYQVHINKLAISAKTMAGVSLLELKTYVRYTFVDHLSDSSASVND